MGTPVIACVCKSGPKFTPVVVKWLQRQVEANVRKPFLFQCLTDIPSEMPGGIALKQDWPRWWPKLELFRPGLWPDGTTVLSMDLDAVLLKPFTVPEPPPVGDLGMLGFGGDWYTPLGSGVMLWKTPLTSPYEWFVSKSSTVMDCIPGDQEAIIAAILSSGHRIHTVPGASAQMRNGASGIPLLKPHGTIWCTAGNGPKSNEISRSWIPKSY